MGGLSNGADRDRGKPKPSQNFSQPEPDHAANVDIVPAPLTCADNARINRARLEANLNAVPDIQERSDLLNQTLRNQFANKSVGIFNYGMIGMLLEKSPDEDQSPKQVTPESFAKRLAAYERNVRNTCNQE